jgi:SOS-response transcriptional repressor LexA
MTDTTEIVYRYIVAYKRVHDGCAPTIRDICDACNISSTSVAAYYLRQLEAAGRIEWQGGAARTIEVVGGRWQPPQEAAAA